MSRLSRLLPRFLRGEKQKNSSSKESGYYHSGYPERSKDGPVCRVLFLDDTDVLLSFKGSSKGIVLHEKVHDHLNLVEKDYFGLRYLDQSDQTHWLDPQKTISAQLKTCSSPYTLYFGVKFYPPDPCKLKEEITRYQFYLQIKRDILQGRLPVTFDEAAELFAYAVQSEIGDYDAKKCYDGYVSEFRFVPNQTVDLEDRIALFHRRLIGQIPAEAEYKFLDKVKWLDMYGVDLHPVLGEGNTEYFLGLTPTGIVVYKNKTKVGNYFWPRISKVTFKGKIFIIKVRDKNNDEHTYAFEISTKIGCKHLWKCCVEHHTFFRLNQIAESFANSEKRYRHSSKRRSGRNERQNISEHHRSQPNVVRVPSRRQPRRSTSDSRLGDGLHYSMINDGPVTRVAHPEPVKGSRHRSLPDLQHRNQSPKSTRSAPWENDGDVGLYTSGRDSPLSMHSDMPKLYRRSAPGSDTESGYRRKYFPKSKGSDNESDASLTRRRRRDADSGSESDVTPARNRRHRNTTDAWFENQWREAMEGMYLPGKESQMNGSVPSIHSAPAGEVKRRRRRRTKSPGTAKRPPEELKQHIIFDLVDTEGMEPDELKDIPFVNVELQTGKETKAEPFKIKYSPHSRQRYRSPKRKSMGDLEPNRPPEEPPPPYTPSGPNSRTTEQNHRSYYSDTNSGFKNDTDAYSTRSAAPYIPSQEHNTTSRGRTSTIRDGQTPEQNFGQMAESMRGKGSHQTSSSSTVQYRVQSTQEQNIDDNTCDNNQTDDTIGGKSDCESSDTKEGDDQVSELIEDTGDRQARQTSSASSITRYNGKSGYASDIGPSVSRRSTTQQNDRVQDRFRNPSSVGQSTPDEKDRQYQQSSVGGSNRQSNVTNRQNMSYWNGGDGSDSRKYDGRDSYPQNPRSTHDASPGRQGYHRSHENRQNSVPSSSNRYEPIRPESIPERPRYNASSYSPERRQNSNQATPERQGYHSRTDGSNYAAMSSLNNSVQRTPSSVQSAAVQGHNTPSSVHNVSSSANRSYGSQDVIKRLYSTPPEAHHKYATQDSIRKLYNTDHHMPSNHVGAKPTISHSSQHSQSHLSHPGNQQHSIRSSPQKQYHQLHLQTSSRPRYNTSAKRGVAQNMIDSSVIPQSFRSPHQRRDLVTEI